MDRLALLIEMSGALNDKGVVPDEDFVTVMDVSWSVPPDDAEKREVVRVEEVDNENVTL